MAALPAWLTPQWHHHHHSLLYQQRFDMLRKKSCKKDEIFTKPPNPSKNLVLWYVWICRHKMVWTIYKKKLYFCVNFWWENILCIVYILYSINIERWNFGHALVLAKLGSFMLPELHLLLLKVRKSNMFKNMISFSR